MISYVLISDGSSDRCLMPIIDYAIVNHLKEPANGIWANFSELITKPNSLIEKLEYCCETYEVDLFIIHRDAENDPNPLVNRRKEIYYSRDNSNCVAYCVPCIPIRMTEAWLLLDELAIRFASSNPNGNVRLNLPRKKDIENIKDPKENLKRLLIKASELSGRRLKKFNTHQKIHLVSEYMDDISVLEGIRSFDYFVKKLKETRIVD